MSDADATAWIVREGQDVLGSDGKKIGEVTGSAGSALIVRHGFLFTARDIYVPINAIAGIDPQAVHLTVPADEATSDGWASPPDGAQRVPNVEATDAGSSGASATGDGAATGDTWTIGEGMAVVGADGEQIGTVEDGDAESLSVRVGRFVSKSITITAAQIADVRDGVVHATITRAALGHGDGGSEASLTDLRGRITNAWRGTKADLDADVPEVDLGKPDPEFPIAPPAGQASYTPSPDAASIEPPTDEAPNLNPAMNSGDIAGVSQRADALDITIDSAATAAEVPGLDRTRAGIPGERDGDHAGSETTGTSAPPAEQSPSFTEVDVVSALSDAGAVGESPDPELAEAARDLAASAEPATPGYTDLPSDPLPGDGDLPEDSRGFATSPAAEPERESFGLSDAAPPVDLPGDPPEEDEDGSAPDPKDAGGDRDGGDHHTRAGITFIPAASPSSPSLGAVAPDPDANLPDVAERTPLPEPDTGSPPPASADWAGRLGQLRNRISTFFDRPEEQTAAQSGADTGRQDTPTPHVVVDATVPDVPQGAHTTARLATDDEPATGAEPASTDDGDAQGHESFVDEIRNRLETFLDNPEAAERPAQENYWHPVADDDAEPSLDSPDAASVSTDDGGMIAPEDAPSPDDLEPEAFAQELYVSDPDINGTVRTVDPAEWEEAERDDDTAARTTSETSDASGQGGIFDELRAKVEHFLDNPDIARSDEEMPTSESSEPGPNADAVKAPTAETASGDAFAAPADSTELISRYAVVADQDDDDLLGGLPDDTGDEPMERAEPSGGDSSNAFLREAGSPLTTVAENPVKHGAADVEVNETASELLVPESELPPEGPQPEDGEQAESNLFAAIVDATSDSDIDGFGTPEEHRVEHSDASEPDGSTEQHEQASSGDAPSAEVDSDLSWERRTPAETFTPTPDAEVLAELPTADDSAAKTEKVNARDTGGAASASATGHEEDTGASSASPETEMTDSARDVPEDEREDGPEPFAGDATIADNAASGKLGGASDAASDATRQDRTIAGNALSGSLSGAGDQARSWTGGERSSTADNAQAAIDGKPATVSGATPLVETSDSATPAEPVHAAPRTRKLHGPAETEGIDWIAADDAAEHTDWLVKGNADSGIYHTQESPSYERTVAEVWFPDAGAAERSGYRAPRTAHHAGSAAAEAAKDAASKVGEHPETDDE